MKSTYSAHRLTATSEWSVGVSVRAASPLPQPTFPAALGGPWLPHLFLGLLSFCVCETYVHVCVRVCECALLTVFFHSAASHILSQPFRFSGFLGKLPYLFFLFFFIK